ncbi:hypothetical protein M0802_010496 [Mischocyttarus mexicanus]|nr:hypothetical protein M0802_010496 [Mischocyttarus mexicanus]
MECGINNLGVTSIRSTCREKERHRGQEQHDNDNEHDLERNDDGVQHVRTSSKDTNKKSNDDNRDTSLSRHNICVSTMSSNQNLPLSLSLEDRELWTRFQCITNEMIVTKNGR